MSRYTTLTVIPGPESEWRKWLRLLALALFALAIVLALLAERALWVQEAASRPGGASSGFGIGSSGYVAMLYVRSAFVMLAGMACLLVSHVLFPRTIWHISRKRN
jgi:hypothetical protein